MSKFDMLTIDPGVNTGWAVWQDSSPEPLFTGVFSAPEGNNFEGKIMYLMLQFRNLIQMYEPELTVIEGVEQLGSSKSRAAGASGALIKLAYIVGVYCATARFFKLMNAHEWKGNMDDKGVSMRVKRRLGKDYRRHEVEAVGIGLAVRGQF